MESHAHLAASQADTEKAALVLERILKGAIFSHNGAGHSQFLDEAKVAIDTRYNQEGPRAVKRVPETLDITITDPHAQSGPKELGNFIISQLASIPSLKDRIHFHEPKEEQKELTGVLDKLIAAGAPIPREFKDWPGFNESNYQVEPHAVKVERTDGDVAMEIRVPKKSKLGAQEVANDIQKRLPQIKEVLAERLSKYTAGDTKKNKEELLQKLNAMEFSTSINEREWYTQVSVTMRSLEQVAAIKQPGGVNATADKAALRATNVLNSVSDTDDKPQLQKALARALFTAGTPNPAMLAAVLGREDIGTYLSKKLKPFLAEKPEFKADVEKLLTSDALKGKDWQPDKDPAPDAKGSYTITKGDKDAGKIHIRLDLPADFSASDALQSIAALAGNNAALATQPNPLTFATVDSVQLVGATSKEALKSAMSILQPQAQQQQAIDPRSPQAVDPLVPFAEELVSAVEQAHQAIQQALKVSAQSTTTAPKPQVTIQHLAARAPQKDCSCPMGSIA